MFSSRKRLLNSRLLALSAIFILLATRVTRRWNQTGNKYASAPDIAKFFFNDHRFTLWVLVGITYLWNIQSLASRSFPEFPQVFAASIATALATASLTFKLAFTNEDSPEIMAGVAKTMAENDVGVSLVTPSQNCLHCNWYRITVRIDIRLASQQAPKT